LWATRDAGKKSSTNPRPLDRSLQKVASLAIIAMNTRGGLIKLPLTLPEPVRVPRRGVPGLSAEEYILESIMTPNAYVVENYKEGDMYQEWGKDLKQAANR